MTLQSSSCKEALVLGPRIRNIMYLYFLFVSQKYYVLVMEKIKTEKFCLIIRTNNLLGIHLNPYTFQIFKKLKNGKP